MSFRRCALTVPAVALLLALAPPARAVPDDPTHIIAANLPDPAIDPSRGENYVWLADAKRRVGKLMVFLPSGGATNFPKDWTELGSESARLGYDTILLAYKNEAPVVAAPPAGCGPGVEAADAPPHCAIDVRMEMLDGGDESSVVAVDRANSIENRLNKTLAYLATQYSVENWSRYRDGAEPKWSDVVIAGASLGAGEAVLIAAKHTVSRVALFHGWTDAKHGWVALGATPPDRYFALIHARDAFFARTCYAYLALELTSACPLDGFTIPPALVDPTNPRFVENRTAPFGTRQLVVDLEPFTLVGVTDPYHSSTTRNGWIAREADLTPSRKLVSAWRAVLGDKDADGQLDQADNCPMAANDQADFDHDGIGDACDPTTTVGGSASGTVASTLSLTLGPAAAFGAFTPGLAKDYTANTTASVTSTAGDAALSVADPSAGATGHLVNGAFSLPSPLQAAARGGAPANVGGAAAPTLLLSYTGPVSNDGFPLTFSQHIGASDALRTGTYGKTLTLTLSTTRP